jgi:hypothetical protein
MTEELRHGVVYRCASDGSEGRADYADPVLAERFADSLRAAGDAAQVIDLNPGSDPR